jgi:hypothetical protein
VFFLKKPLKRPNFTGEKKNGNNQKGGGGEREENQIGIESKIP